MSTTSLPDPSRWLNRKGTGLISADFPMGAPTKPSEALFTPTTLVTVAFIDTHSDRRAPERKDALALVNRIGVRRMQIEGSVRIGIWADLDAPEIRDALSVLGHAQSPVGYLEETGIPAQYKDRSVPGEAVPPSVIQRMKRHSKPWLVRDQFKEADRKEVALAMLAAPEPA